MEQHQQRGEYMSLYSHSFVGTNDLEKSRKFYDAVMPTVGAQFVGAEERRFFYMKDGQAFAVGLPYDGEAAASGNGHTVGFNADSKEAVDAFHAAGLANGGTCEGKPGPREGAMNRYGAYLRDPYGNKLCAFTPTPV